MKDEMRLFTFHVVLNLILLFEPLIVSAYIVKTKKTVCKSEECTETAKNLINTIDTSVEPCDNFYQYACGKKWKHEFAVAPILSRNGQNNKEISEFLEQNNNENEPESVHKARQLYSACLDQKSFKGAQEVRDILQKIGLPTFLFATNNNSEFDYIGALARTRRLIGIKMFFSIEVGPNPYNHSINEIWLSRPSITKLESHHDIPLIMDINTVKFSDFPTDKTNYMKNVIEKMCKLASSSNCTANESELIGNILKLEEHWSMLISKPKDKLSSSYEPTIHTLEELQNISDNIADEVKPTIPKLNWTNYFQEIFNGLGNVTLDFENATSIRIVTHEMNIIQDIIKFIYERKIKEIEIALWWQVVSTLLPHADFEIFQEKEETKSFTKEVRCQGIVTSSFGMAIGYMYLKKEKYNKAKIEAEEAFEYIKKNYAQTLESATWMDQETKRKSLKKLASVKSFIGYPELSELNLVLDEMYSTMKIMPSFLGTMLTQIQDLTDNSFSRLNQINKPIMEKIWLIPPTLVNAFYHPRFNLMVIPAAVLGSPLYIDSLKSLFYGSIGYIIGHEISHGFDYNGRKYNDVGELEEWWNNNTLVKYKEKSKCFTKAYNNYYITFQNDYHESDIKVESTQTLLEDISDNVGFKVALFGYKSYVSKKGEEPSLPNFDNFTQEQLFTLAFASFFCESSTASKDSFVANIDHGPAEIRVNGVLKNSQEFPNIWNCPVGSNMNPVDEKCSLW